MKRWKIPIMIMDAKTLDDALEVLDELYQRMADYRDSGNAPQEWRLSDFKPECYEEE